MNDEEIKKKVLNKVFGEWDMDDLKEHFDIVLQAIDLTLKLKEAEHEKEIASLKKQIDMFII